MASIKKSGHGRPTGSQEWNQLRPVVEAMVEGRAPEEVAAVIVDQTVRLVRVKAAGLWQVDRSRSGLYLVAQRGFDENAKTSLHCLPLSAPFLTARMVGEGQTTEILGVPGTDSESPLLQRLTEHGSWGSVLALPRFAHARPIGALVCVKEVRQGYTEAERAVARALGDLWAIAIGRAEELESATEELRQVNQRLAISNVRAQELREATEAARDRATKLNSQLEQALQVRQEFMAAAAHELRSPVTVIRGRTQMLLKNETQNSHARQSIETILGQTDRIAQLVDDLLTSLRLQSGGPELQPERFDLNALIEEQVGRLARTSAKGRFRVDPHGALVVDADRELIGEVLRHVLENALRYSQDAEPIEIKARRHADEAVVSVADLGVGISPERQSHVFEPLYESVPPGESGYQSVVSLGLYLSKEIVDRHGGRIWFTSVPGEGSTFSFSLPLVDDDQGRSARPNTSNR